MKNVKLLSAVALCSLLSITGCKKGGGEKVDETKAQLQVSTFEGGVGDQWLRNAPSIHVLVFAMKETISLWAPQCPNKKLRPTL